MAMKERALCRPLLQRHDRVTVREQLRNIGRCDPASSERLEIVVVDHRPVATDGAARAEKLITELL